MAERMRIGSLICKVQLPPVIQVLVNTFRQMLCAKQDSVGVCSTVTIHSNCELDGSPLHEQI